MTQTHKISLQDIFNAAWQAFIIEKKPPAVHVSISGIMGRCSYLTQDGHRCAVGLCLPDDIANKCRSMYFNGVVREYPDLFCSEIILMYDADLIKFQRSLHDSHVNEKTGEWTLSPDELKAQYIKVAHNFKLNIPIYTIQSK